MSLAPFSVAVNQGLAKRILVGSYHVGLIENTDFWQIYSNLLNSAWFTNDLMTDASMKLLADSLTRIQAFS
jgi:hypothetical protein